MSSLSLESLAMLNAQINGSMGTNLSAAIEAVTSRTDEINICGTVCTGTCDTCIQAQVNLVNFYATESEPIEVQVMAPAADEEQQAWEDQVMAARALDEAEEAARTAAWADYDAPDNRSLSDDDDDDDDDDSNDFDSYYFDSFDERQNYYNDEWDTGLDWNESGYFD